MTSTTIAHVQEAVCRRFDITLAELTGDCRSRDVALPRQLAYLACRKLTGRSSTNIGRHFGGRDHSTVLKGVHAAQARMGSDPVWAGHYAAVREVLGL